MNVSLDNVKFMTNNNATSCMVFSVSYFLELHRAITFCWECIFSQDFFFYVIKCPYNLFPLLVKNGLYSKKLWLSNSK